MPRNIKPDPQIVLDNDSDFVFSTPDGFLRARAGIVGNSGACPQYVEVTGLSIPSFSAKIIQLHKSFPGYTTESHYYPYCATIFMFDDGTSLPYDGSVDDLSDPNNKTTFSERVQNYWLDGNRDLSGIQFERRELKPIPKKK